MKGSTVSDQYNYGPTSGHADDQKREPCVERGHIFSPASYYASVISHLLSQPEANCELDPSFLLPSPQKTELGFQSSGNGASSREASSMNQLPVYSLSNSSHNKHLQAKRARVENIIRGMSIMPTPIVPGTLGEGDQCQAGKVKEDYRENKRKQRLPQQQSLHENSLARPGRSSVPTEECLQLKKQLHVLQLQLKQLQERFLPSSELNGSSQSQGSMEKMMDLLKEKFGQSLDNSNQSVISDRYKDNVQRHIPKMRGPELLEEETGMMDSGISTSEERPLSEILKHELIQVVTQAVDSVLKKALSKSAGLQSQLPNGPRVSVSPTGREFVGAGENASSQCLPKMSPYKASMSLITEKPPAFPTYPIQSKMERKLCQVPPANCPLIMTSSEVQGSGIFSQMLLCGQNGQWSSPPPRIVSSPKSLDVPWQPIKLKPSVMRQQRCPTSCRSAEMEDYIQEALTPGHLKKAKLMFFFSRYPTSSLLKAYFLDVQFTRCITSQLIKWFSNFREFYYIQMEKFARQALLEGVTDPSNLIVTRDSELFRILNVHYNKGNDFEVPDGFLDVASLTLKEFFSAVRAGKDLDPSWKKPIYKIISKLDSEIPDGFKCASFPKELIQG